MCQTLDIFLNLRFEKCAAEGGGKSMRNMS